MKMRKRDVMALSGKLRDFVSSEAIPQEFYALNGYCYIGDIVEQRSQGVRDESWDLMGASRMICTQSVTVSHGIARDVGGCDRN